MERIRLSLRLRLAISQFDGFEMGPQTPTGVLKVAEANDRRARAVCDFSVSAHPTGSSWTRWLLHPVNEPGANGMLARAGAGAGWLFCRTLLPEDARIVRHGGTTLRPADEKVPCLVDIRGALGATLNWLCLGGAVLGADIQGVRL